MLRDHLRAHGPLATAHLLTYRALNRLVSYQTFIGMWISSSSFHGGAVRPGFLFDSRFLTHAEIIDLPSHPELEVTERFVDRALEKGDACFGIFDRQRLVSYSWYSRLPTWVSGELAITFDPDYTDMFKGFTLPAYRGKRLYAAGIYRAALAEASRGSKGLVSLVESANFAARRSLARMGHKAFGTIRVFRAFGASRISATESCGRFGVSLTAIQERPTRLLERGEALPPIQPPQVAPRLTYRSQQKAHTHR